MKAQGLDNHVGKTLRIKDDGTVPPNNPFVGRAGAKPEIFTYGHRNGYGLAFNPATGELWQAEIGPLGYDDRIIRRKAKATRAVHAWTDEAERLLTLRESHRLTGIPPVPRSYAA